MIVRLAQEHDFAGFLALAAQVEHWFGPMVEEVGFRNAVQRHIDRSAALVAVSSGPDLVGGLLFGAKEPVYHVRWLVVSQEAQGTGVGRALMEDALGRWVHGPGTIEVVTFGADHPGAVLSGARVFYERLGFAPAEDADPGPEGGSRQVFRRAIVLPIPSAPLTVGRVGGERCLKRSWCRDRQRSPYSAATDTALGRRLIGRLVRCRQAATWRCRCS